MNKKAMESAYEMMMWVATIITVAIVVVSIVFLINGGVKKQFDIERLQQTILMQRFVYSENCLAYGGNNGVEAGIIDKSKFLQNRLENCFKTDEKTGASLNLVSDDVKTINLNNKLTDKFSFCFDKKHFTCSNYTYYVLVKDNDIKTGLLKINMIKLK